ELISPPPSSSLIAGAFAQSAEIEPADLQRCSLADPDADLEIVVILDVEDREDDLKPPPAAERAQAKPAQRDGVAGSVADDVERQTGDERQALIEPRVERHCIGTARQLDVRPVDHEPGGRALGAHDRGAG